MGVKSTPSTSVQNSPVKVIKNERAIEDNTEEAIFISVDVKNEVINISQDNEPPEKDTICENEKRENSEEKNVKDIKEEESVKEAAIKESEGNNGSIVSNIIDKTDKVFVTCNQSAVNGSIIKIEPKLSENVYDTLEIEEDKSEIKENISEVNDQNEDNDQTKVKEIVDKSVAEEIKDNKSESNSKSEIKDNKTINNESIATFLVDEVLDKILANATPKG